jgi:hypothetical protein
MTLTGAATEPRFQAVPLHTQPRSIAAETAAIASVVVGVSAVRKVSNRFCSRAKDSHDTEHTIDRKQKTKTREQNIYRRHNVFGNHQITIC